MLPRHSPLRIVARAVTVLLVSGLAGAMLVRFAPGFGMDDRMLDPRLSAESIQLIEHEHGRQNAFADYIVYLRGLIHGEAGRSVVYGQPVAQLIAERAPTTIHAVSWGLAGGWIAAILIGVVAALTDRTAITLPAMTLSGSLLSIPSALLATICLLLRLSPAVAVAAVLFPRLFPYVYEQIRANSVVPHVIMARAKGLPRVRLFLCHVVPGALPPLFALAGVSVTLALGTSIPIEALADSPGLGQLAWRAAVGRDIPVLVSITLLLTTATVSANVLADILILHLGRRGA